MYVDPGVQKRKHCQVQPEVCPAPYFKYHPSQRNSESSREAVATEDPNLEELPELGLEVTCFLRGTAENSEEEDEKMSSSQGPSERVLEVGDMEG